MEQEFKWDAFATLQDAVLIWALNRDADHARITEMDAQYFDTPDGALAAEQAALRLRRENETGICCLKLRGGKVVQGLHAHEEYECLASCVSEGLSTLPDVGAPIELCCGMAVQRLSLRLTGDGCPPMAKARRSAKLNWNTNPARRKISMHWASRLPANSTSGRSR